MKKLKIRSFIRPAIYSDLFDLETEDIFKKNQQIFYKENGLIRGPYKITVPDLFPGVEYDNYVQLLKEERIFVLDKSPYLESILVELPLKEAEPHDLLEFNFANGFMEHTIFYIIRNNEVSGPFKMTQTALIYDINKYTNRKELFVLDAVSDLKKVEITTTA